ncbi:predicted protein, partial [Naegleria gruberi]
LLMMMNTIPLLTLGIQTTPVYVPHSDFMPSPLHPNINTTTTTIDRSVRSVSCGGTFFVVRLWDSIGNQALNNAAAEELYIKFSTPKTTQSPYFKSLNYVVMNDAFRNVNGGGDTSVDVLNNDSNPFYQLDYRLAIEELKLGNCYQVENVFCNQVFIILQMRNKLILAIESSSGTLHKSKKFMDDSSLGIKEIVSGPLALHILVRGTDNMVYYFRADASSFSEDPKLHLDLTERKYVMSALSGRSTFV